MEIQRFEVLYDELTKSHSQFRYAEQAFGMFTQHAIAFIEGHTGSLLKLSHQSENDALIIKSPLVSIRVKLTVSQDASLTKGVLVCHRTPSDPDFERSVLVADVPIDARGETNIKLDGSTLNVVNDIEAACLVMHLLSTARRTPLVRRQFDGVTSG